MRLKMAAADTACPIHKLFSQVARRREMRASRNPALLCPSSVVRRPSWIRRGPLSNASEACPSSRTKSVSRTDWTASGKIPRSSRPQSPRLVLCTNSFASVHETLGTSTCAWPGQRDAKEGPTPMADLLSLLAFLHIVQSTLYTSPMLHCEFSKSGLPHGHCFVKA